MLQDLRRIKKVVLWFLILFIIATGGVIGYLKMGFGAPPEIFHNPYMLIPIALVFIVFVLFLFFKKSKNE